MSWDGCINTIEVLDSLTAEELAYIYSQAYAWENVFPECVCYTIDELVDLYYGSERDLLYMLKDQRLDLDSEVFWCDDVYWYDGDYDTWVDSTIARNTNYLADWLCGQAGRAGSLIVCLMNC